MMARYSRRQSRQRSAVTARSKKYEAEFDVGETVRVGIWGKRNAVVV